MDNHSVWALQINLNDWARSAGVKPVEETGYFGTETTHLSRVFQRRKGLVIDGLVGPTTQRYLALDLSRPAQRTYQLPPGLVRGIVQGETGWAVGAVNWSVPGGVDCGWAQIRVTEPYTDAKFVFAFRGLSAFDELGSRLSRKKNDYYGRPGATTLRRAWELGLLFWNWQHAAERYAAGLKDWSYYETWHDENGTHTAVRLMSQPAEWIKTIGVPGVETGHQWATHYINSKTLYVDWSKV
jgi:hypothetical protein